MNTQSFNPAGFLERRLVNMIEVCGYFRTFGGWFSPPGLEFGSVSDLQLRVNYHAVWRQTLKRKKQLHTQATIFGSLVSARSGTGSRILQVDGWDPCQFFTPGYEYPIPVPRGQLHGRIIELLPRNIVAVMVESVDGGRVYRERFELLASPEQYEKLRDCAGSMLTFDYVLGDLGGRRFEGLPLVKSFILPNMAALRWH
ncbi:MAG: hypothetical protein IT462_11645 [Planctomycetes bacterium]|nr:hypothetical protein [Planctomycetota bacterium]